MKWFALMVLLPGMVFAQGYRPNASLQVTALRVEEVTLGEDLSFRTLVLTKNEEGADTLALLGGRLRLVPYEVNANAWLDFSTSTGFRLGNQLNIADGAFLRVDNVLPARDSETISLYGAHGLTPTPQATVDACTSGREGQITTLTTDGFAYQCNGAINTRLQGALWSAVTSLDFGDLASHASETLTVTVTGATTADLPVCRPAGGHSSVTDIDIHEAITTPGAVDVTAHNDSGGNINPGARNYQCVVFVK